MANLLEIELATTKDGMNWEMFWPSDIPHRQSFLDLHPVCRGAFCLLQVRLLEAWARGAIGNRFLAFEGYRTPDRQDQLYGQGRTKPGQKVTKARAWESAHQFGLAVDFVPYDDKNPSGKEAWHWSEDADWNALHELALARGLRCGLRGDRPHIWHPHHDVLVSRLR